MDREPENLAVFLWQKCNLCTSNLCQCSKLKLMAACVIVIPSPHFYTQKMLFTPVVLFHIISHLFFTLQTQEYSPLLCARQFPATQKLDNKPHWFIYNVHVYTFPHY